MQSSVRSGPSEAGQLGWPGPPHFSCHFFVVLVGSHRTSSEVWSDLGLARTVAHSYERERGMVRDTL